MKMSEVDLINCVEDNLWIGGIAAALNVELLEDKKIAYILTVDVKPLLVPSSPNHLHVSAADLSSEDLFIHFEKVFHFIKSGKEKGGVLVHCFHGVSRSATLVTSYLMRKYNISTGTALQRVKTVRPSVQPNEGFMSQLKLYETLLKYDKLDSVIARFYSLNCAATNISIGDGIMPGETIPQLITNDKQRSGMRCKKCRLVLASHDDIISHKAGEDPCWREDNWVTFALGDESSDSCTKAFFVIPKTWMLLDSELKGKLQCPKCQSKVGAFDWVQPVMCPCSASFRPSFYLIASKVDLIK